MISGRKYHEEIHQVSSGGKTVTVRNLSPVYPEQEQKKAKEEINQTLYAVFAKYR